jgi:cobalt transporter subunit CbtB
MAMVIQPGTDAVGIDIPRWTWLVMALAMFASYVIVQEGGWLTSHWMVLHEAFHDGRHALGFPCH